MPVTLDFTYLKSLTRDDRVFEKTLLSGAFADIDQKMEELKLAWEAGDGPGVRQAAHSLVSLCAIAGMPTVEQKTRGLDQLFADRLFHADQAPLFQDIMADWQDAKPQLLALLSTY
jgi:hypothetical protein